MKYRFLYILLVAFLFTANPSCFAAYRLKKVTVTTTAASAAAGMAAAAHNGVATLQQRSPYSWPIRGTRERPSEWFNYVAFGSGFLGLFIPGLNFAAILFGLLGMRKGNRMRGLAVTGFILGMLELLLFVFFETTFIALLAA